MAKLTVVADIVANAGEEDFVRGEMVKMIAPTREEKGCEAYDLHTDNDDPTHFVFYETWTTPGDLDAHMKSAHIQAFVKATEGKIASLKISKMAKVE